MKEIPILFNTPMVQAILDGRKTQTRWAMKTQPPEWATHAEELASIDGVPTHFEFWRSDRFGGGDYVWPYELCGVKSPFGKPGGVLFAKDFKWKPSIYMPKGACRLKLRVKRVWVERVQDISEEDAIKEGIDPNCCIAKFIDRKWTFPQSTCDIQGDDPDCHETNRCGWRNYMLDEDDCGEPCYDPVGSFGTLWDSIYGTWNDNDWVWACEFEVIR